MNVLSVSGFLESGFLNASPTCALVNMRDLGAVCKNEDMALCNRALRSLALASLRRSWLRRREPIILRSMAVYGLPRTSYTPGPNVMTDFNAFTFNGRTYPGTSRLVIRKDQRARIHFANVSMDSHPIHIHGHSFTIVETDGGQLPKSTQ